MSRISGKRPSSALRVEPGLNPNQPSHRIRTPEPEQGHAVPRDRPRLAVVAVLAAPRAQQQQRREAAGRADQVDRRRAGEVLHADDRAEVALQQAAAEHPVGADRVDDRGEDDRVDDVDAELDPLERRAPDDRQRDGAEHELEEELRLDRRVGERHHGEVGWNVVTPSAVAETARVGGRTPVWPMISPAPNANAKPHAYQASAAIEKLVRIFATIVPAFLPRENPISRKANPACMKITRQRGDDHPHRVDRRPTGLEPLPAIASSRGP